MAKGFVNILLVEDELSDARILRRLLDTSPDQMYEVIHVQTVKDATRMLSSDSVDLVLLDLSLTDSKGIATVEVVHATDPGVPIVVLTGHDDEDTAVEAIRHGAQDYLVKGRISRTMISRAIKYALERKKIEDDLRNQAELLQSILRNSGDGIIVTDTNARHILSNPAAEALLGLRPTDEPVDHLVKKYGLYLPDTITPYPADRLPLLRAISGEEVTDELIFVRNPRHPNGIWISANARPLRDLFGKIIGGVLGLRDVTDRMLATEEVKRMNIALSNAVDGISQIDSEGMFLSANDAFGQMIGYQESELIGERWGFFVTEGDCARVSNAFEHMMTAGKAELDVRVIKKDGSLLDVHCVLMKDKHAGFFFFMKDMTEQIRSQELKIVASALERSNKELDEFASVVSHDLQEPLRKIRAFGDLLKLKYAGCMIEETRDCVERMQNAATRMQGLINGLLRYARATGARRPFTLVNLSKVAADVMTDLEVTISRTGARVEVDLLPTIEADSMQMNQLFLNLLANSLKFQNSGTVPHIKISYRPSKFKDRASGRLIHEHEISFADNGTGFDGEKAGRLFTIFCRLSEHAAYEGTGIGLAICRKIVEGHGGKITARSRPGEGTTIVVTLPEKQHLGGTEK